MAVRTEELQLRVVIDGSPARRELAQLDQEYAEIKASMRDLKKGTDEWVAASARLDQIGARQAELRKEIGLTGLTAKQLGDELKRLQVQQRNLTPNTAQWAETTQRIEQVKARLRELNDVNARSAAAWEVQRKAIRLTDMTMEELELESRRLMAQLRTMNPNSAEFGRLARELRNVDSRMQTLRAGMTPFNRMWQDLKSNLLSAGAVMGGLFAGSALMSGIQNLVRGSAALSDELADIGKATGLSADQVVKLNSELQKIDTRTSTSELRNIAVGLGQVGETVSASAVAAIDKINVALGDEFGTGAKEITTTISVLRNNLRDLKTADYGDDVMRIGNALNELGANGLATAPVVSDIANRVAGLAGKFGVTSGQILGTAATFQELGIEVERGSTAYGKVLQRIAQEPKKFADVVRAAGMDADLFTRQVNEDMQAAFITVAKAARVAGTDNAAFAAILKELDVDGAGVSELLSKMGENAAMLAAKTKLATDALQETSSVTEEFNTKNATLAAVLEKIGKELNRMFVSSALARGMESLVRSFGALLGLNVKLSETIGAERLEMNALFDVMKRGNITTEQRRDLIQEINTKYADYLPAQVSEFANLQAIEAAQRAVNDAMLKRIEIEAKRELIKEQMERVAAAQKALLQAELDLARFRQNPVQQGNLSDRTLTMEARVAAAGADLKAATAAYQDIMARLGDALVEPKKVAPFQFNTGAFLNQLKGAGVTGATEEGGAPPGAISDADSAEQKRRMQAWEAELEAFRERVLQAGMSADEAELRQLDQKHAEERAKLNANAKATAEDLLAQETLHAEERAALIEAQGNRRLEAYQDAERTINEALRAGASERLKDEVAIWDTRIERARASGADVTALERERALALLAVLEDEYRQRLAAEIAHWDRLIEVAKEAGIDTAALEDAKGRAINAITKKWEEKGVQDTEDAEMRKRAARVKSLQDFGQVANSFGNVLDSLAALQQAKHDEDGVRTEEEKREQRDLAMLILAVKTAAAIATGVAQAMELPYPANIAAALSTVATVTGLIAQAQALMNDAGSSAPPPAATTTTVNNMPLAEKGGVFEGPSHDRGGLQVWDPVAKRQVAEVEGGEPWMVLSKAFRRNNAALIPLLLEASATGAKVPMGAAGGVFAPGPAFNFRQASRAVKMAAGGLTTRGVAMVNAAGGGDDSLNGSFTLVEKKGLAGGGGTPGWAQALLEEMRGLRALAQRPVQVHNALQVDARVKLGQDYDREQTKWAMLKARNTIPKK